MKEKSGGINEKPTQQKRRKKHKERYIYIITGLS